MKKNTGVNPKEVVSPQSSWQLIDVLYENEDWSMALGRWKSEDNKWKPVLGQRWNGWEGTKGNPLSRGYPVWFVLPDDTYDLYIESRFIPADKRPFVRDILGLPKSAAA